MQQRVHSVVDTIYQVVEDGLRRGVAHLSTNDRRLDGRGVTIRDQPVLNFGSCSYLGLETDPRLIEGIQVAAEQFGSQFSSSRAYLSLGLYDILEEQLARLFGQPVVVGASTSLLHQSALPVLVEEGDAVILDHMVHASVQNAAQLLKARGIRIEVVRHSRLDQLEEKVVALKARHRKVWYLADGVYSMYGDFAPLPALEQLLARHEQLWLYIDDAHGMGWTGPHGCGVVHSRLRGQPKVVLAVSLNKSFAAAGGAVVLPDPALAKRVRACGPTLIFSGPIQPPMLGACIASAEIHLSAELPALQAELAERVEFVNQTIRALGLPQIAHNESPLFFIPIGLPKLVYGLIEALHDAGFHANGGLFPAVPMMRGGLRFTVTRHLGQAEIGAMLERVHHAYCRLTQAEGITPQGLAQNFRMPHLAECDWSARTPRGHGAAAVALLESARPTTAAAAPSRRGLRLHSQATLSPSEAAHWDQLIAGRGPMTSATLEVLSQVFVGQDETQRIDLRHVRVEDALGATVLATFYVVALVKDDMFESAEISLAVEVRRRSEPLYLTSRAVVLGSPVSSGDPLYLDRQHPQWRGAVAMLIDELKGVMAAEGASRIMLRDFPQGDDEALRDLLFENGLSEYRLPDKLLLNDLTWRNRLEFLQRLGSKYRYNVRREALDWEGHFVVETTPPQGQDELMACYQLYCQVQERGAEINVFRLPFAYFEAICADPSYDIIRLYLRDGAAHAPVAVMFSHVADRRYSALMVGLDYEHLYRHKVYKQILFQTVERARALGCATLDLGFTATLEKKKLGARPQPTCAYVMLDDHYQAEVLHSIA